MTRFSVLAVDDEPLARRMVATMLRADDEVSEVFECPDSASALEAIRERRPDIVFLDIEMPDVSGLDLAGTLHEDGPVVVFVTAFNRYAPEAFEVNACDYVLKPFSEQRFSDALQRAKRRVRERRLGALASQLAMLSSELRPDNGEKDLAGRETTYIDHLSLKHADRTVIVPIGEVNWIEAEDYYVRVHSSHGRHLVRTPLATLEARLNPRDFLRVHRGAIVNVQKVARVRANDGCVLVIDDGTEVPVSRSRRAAVEARLTSRGSLSRQSA